MAIPRGSREHWQRLPLLDKQGMDFYKLQVCLTKLPLKADRKLLIQHCTLQKSGVCMHELTYTCLGSFTLRIKYWKNSIDVFISTV